MRMRWMAALGICGVFFCSGGALGAEVKRLATDKALETGKASERSISMVDRQKGREHLLKVVVLSRHGVRSPTERREELRQWTKRAWPAWKVKRGELTPRGAELITALWEQERNVLAKSGLMPSKGCPEEGSVFVYADRDQRTRETARALLKGLAPGCGFIPAVVDKAGPDPLFHPLEGGQCRVDEKAAARQTRLAMRGSPDAVIRDEENALLLLGKIAGPLPADQCEKAGLPQNCTAVDMPTQLRIDAKGARLEGGLSTASRLAEIFFLEYAQWPKQDAGWGEVDAETLRTIMPVHARVFDILHKTPALAVGGSALLNAMTQALTSAHAEAAINQARLVVFVGHDTNIANVAGLLDLDWKLGDYAPGQIPPGSALVFTLWKKADGSRVVRAHFRGQSVQTLHDATVRSVPFLETALLFPDSGKKGVPSSELSVADFEARVNSVVDKGCVPPQGKLVMRRKTLD